MILAGRNGDGGKTGTALNFSRHGAFTPHEFMTELRKKFPALRDVLLLFSFFFINIIIISRYYIIYRVVVVNTG